MWERAQRIAERLRTAGAAEVLFVGGCVRDRVLGLPSKDIDLEVYGFSYAQIEEALRPFHDVRPVGLAFGVLKVDGLFDVSVPRRENKIGVGHRGFSVEPDPDMTPRDAAARRDFTINSLALTMDGRMLDFFGGLDDLRAGLLRATSAAFSEDPLRVLRGVQFAGRFDMTMVPNTVEICRRMHDQYQELPKERVFEEWWKWASKSTRPSRGLEVLRLVGWDTHYTMLPPLQTTLQDPVWHPEGDVWTHTLLVCDAAAEIGRRERLPEDESAALLFAALCHDFGKGSTSQLNATGRWVAPEHAVAGVAMAREFLEQIGAPQAMAERVCPLVREHLVHIATPEPTPRLVRRLANRLAPSTMKMWSHMVEADHSGRLPLPRGNPVIAWVTLAEELAISESKPRPLVMGRHLIARGWTPGPHMGVALRAAFEAQLDGAFADVEAGLTWISRQTQQRGDN